LSPASTAASSSVFNWQEQQGRLVARQQRQRQQQHSRQSGLLSTQSCSHSSSSSSTSSIHDCQLSSLHGRCQQPSSASMTSALVAGGHSPPHVLPSCTAPAAQQASSHSRVVPSWPAGSSYTARRGWSSAAAGSAAALSDSWRAKVPSKMTFEEKQEVRGGRGDGRRSSQPLAW
jgi:hypothetical protein